MKTTRRRSRGVVRTDQRKNRSDVPLEAARLYLEAVAGRSDARALALSNEDGLLVAGTRGDYDLEGLAAVGAACVQGQAEIEVVETMIDSVAGGADLYASGLTIEGSSFCLTSVGARVRSVKDTTAALSRILALAPARPETGPVDH
jgi:hypothetical protein